MLKERTIDQVPYLSAGQIETNAESLRKEINFLGLTPAAELLDRVVEHLRIKYKLHTNLNEELGKDNSGKVIVGVCKFRPPAILINQNILAPLKVPFVLGHEIGHFILHRNIAVQQETYDNEALVHPEYDWAKGRKKMVTARDRMEWQANIFSSALLMPSDDLANAIALIQKEIGINRNFGKIYLNGWESIKDFETIKNILSDVLGIAPLSIEIRMKDLNLIIDDRKSKTDHFSITRLF